MATSLPSACRLSTICERLDISQSYEPPWPVTETAVPFSHVLKSVLLEVCTVTAGNVAYIVINSYAYFLF
jgi:hypothetical protein